MKSSARNSLKRLTSLNWSEWKKSLLSCSRIDRSSADCMVSVTVLVLFYVARRSLQVGGRFSALHAPAGVPGCPADQCRSVAPSSTSVQLSAARTGDAITLSDRGTALE